MGVGNDNVQATVSLNTSRRPTPMPLSDLSNPPHRTVRAYVIRVLRSFEGGDLAILCFVRVLVTDLVPDFTTQRR